MTSPFAREWLGRPLRHGLAYLFISQGSHVVQAFAHESRS